MTETTKRILELMEQRGDTAYSLEKNIELPISTVAAWKKGKFKPSADAITKVAQYYNVSTDYLLCLTDDPIPPQKSNDLGQTNPFLSTYLAELAREQRFIKIGKMYNALPDKQREQVYGVVQGIVIGVGLDINKILGR